MDLSLGSEPSEIDSSPGCSDLMFSSFQNHEHLCPEHSFLSLAADLLALSLGYNLPNRGTFILNYGIFIPQM